MRSCTTCGRPPQSVCEPCSTGNPPPERIRDLELEAAERRRRRLIRVRREIVDGLAQLPDAYAYLELFRAPSNAAPARSGDEGRQKGGGPTSPSRPTIGLGLVDITDRREKTVADPHRDDYAQGITTESATRRQGAIPTLSGWCRRVTDELLDEGTEHLEFGVDSCSATCTEAPNRAKLDDRAGPCSENLRGHATYLTIIYVCSWLHSHLEWMVERPWADKLAADLTGLLQDIRHLIREPTDEEKILPCPGCSWNMVGQGDYDTERGRYPWYRCTGCRRAITTQSELDRADRQARDTVTLRYAAGELGRPLSTLKEWAQRGWIQTVGRDRRGNLYSLRTLQKLDDNIRHGRKFQPGKS